MPRRVQQTPQNNHKNKQPQKRIKSRYRKSTEQISAFNQRNQFENKSKKRWIFPLRRKQTQKKEKPRLQEQKQQAEQHQ